MKEFIEKLIKRLEKLGWVYKDYYPDETEIYDEVVKIVNELVEEYKPKTQADKIRAMSDEELAEFFSERDKIPNRYKCKEIDDWIKWLKSERE